MTMAPTTRRRSSRLNKDNNLSLTSPAKNIRANKRNNSVRTDSGIDSDPSPSEKVTPVKEQLVLDISTSDKNKIEPAFKAKPIDIRNMDVSQLLALGEKEPSGQLTIKDIDSDESGQSDFEEVNEREELRVLKEGVNITLEAPLFSFKRKKKTIDVESVLLKQLRRTMCLMQISKHQVHILGWIAHMKFVNGIINDGILQAISLSFLTKKTFFPPKKANCDYLQRILTWYTKEFSQAKSRKDEPNFESLRNKLLFEFVRKQSFDPKHYALLFVIILRSLGLHVRFVMSLNVVSAKPHYYDLKNMTLKNVKKNPELLSSLENIENNMSTGGNCIKKNSRTASVGDISKDDVVAENKSDITKKDYTLKKEIDRRVFSSDDEEPDEKPVIVKEKSPEKVISESSSEDEASLAKLGKRLCRSKSRKITYDDSDSDVSVGKKKIKRSLTIKGNNKRNPKKEDNESDSDDDFYNIDKFKKHGRKVLTTQWKPSAEEENLIISSKRRKKAGVDVWAEVYLEGEMKWISVDVVRGKINCSKDLGESTTYPIIYILACNNDSTLKDVTRRYVLDYHAETRKRRIADDWWNETMEPYLPPSNVRERHDDEEMAQQIENLPLPTKVTEFKSHPLYALKRHLLKFEAIYPPNAPPLGYIKDEPIYARECVAVLKSRDTWFKEARVVRANETAYKVVKARPKYDKMSGEYKNDLPLDLFGRWQTDEYIPPHAKNGKVPRNEYGNVDLFQPCMLPGGTVHLQIPALNRIARKLGIDCAPAIVGFEYHKRFRAHPVQDGFVVCEESRHRLANAWKKEVEVAARRSEMKRTKRIFGNWRRLIRGLLIRENLKAKYSFGGLDSADKAVPLKAKMVVKKKVV